MLEKTALHMGLARVCRALQEAAASAGVSLTSVPDPEQAECEVSHDPFDGVQCLTAVFRVRGSVDGKVQIRADGNVVGEFASACMHPKKRDLFVEAIDAWGQLDEIRTDLRLVPLSPELAELMEY